MRWSMLILLCACNGAPAPEAPQATTKPESAPCDAGTDCESGVCQGQGCAGSSAGNGGRCMPPTQRCLRNRIAFCGCDGVTFYAASNCPLRTYRYSGVCEASE